MHWGIFHMQKAKTHKSSEVIIDFSWEAKNERTDKSRVLQRPEITTNDMGLLSKTQFALDEFKMSPQLGTLRVMGTGDESSERKCMIFFFPLTGHIRSLEAHFHT